MKKVYIRLKGDENSLHEARLFECNSIQHDRETGLTNLMLLDEKGKADSIYTVHTVSILDIRISEFVEKSETTPINEAEKFVEDFAIKYLKSNYSEFTSDVERMAQKFLYYVVLLNTFKKKFCMSDGHCKLGVYTKTKDMIESELNKLQVQIIHTLSLTRFQDKYILL